MKTRKDKTNTAVYDALREYTGHPIVCKELIQQCIAPKNTYKNGFLTEYRDQEYLASQYFKHTILRTFKDGMLQQHYGADRGKLLGKKLVPPLYCKGIVYKKKNTYQCHHPLCPICFSRKQYRLINHLKPHLQKGRKLKLVRISEFVYHTMDKRPVATALTALETIATRFTKSISKHVCQWIRQPHIQKTCDSEGFDVFPVSYLIPLVYDESNEETIMQSIRKLGSRPGSIDELPCAMDSMSELLTKHFYFDPMMAKSMGYVGMVEYEGIFSAGKYRAKHGGK